MRFVVAQETRTLFVRAELLAGLDARTIVRRRRAADSGQILLDFGQAFARRQRHGFDDGFHGGIVQYFGRLIHSESPCCATWVYNSIPQIS